MKLDALVIGRGIARSFIRKRGVLGTIMLLEEIDVNSSETGLATFIKDFVREVTGKDFNFEGNVADLIRSYGMEPSDMIELIMDKDKSVKELIQFFNDFELFQDEPRSGGDHESDSTIMVLTPIG